MIVGGVGVKAIRLTGLFSTGGKISEKKRNLFNPSSYMSIVYGGILYTLYHYRIEDDEIVMLLRSNSTRRKRLKLVMG